jgi:hypothetical protein
MRIISFMPRCHVSFADPEEHKHSVEIEAESLYEAVALAVADFIKIQSNATPLPDNTEFTITTLHPTTEHRMKLLQVKRWAAPSAIGGPANAAKRERVRALLGEGA